MFVNDQQVLAITGKVVTDPQIAMAQSIVESYMGRTEDDIWDADDYQLVAKAVAYQTVYMLNDSERVFEQVALVQSSQMDGSMTIDRDMAAPFVAPLAVIALRKVSWKKSRSVKTGPIFGRTWYAGWERD